MSIVIFYAGMTLGFILGMVWAHMCFSSSRKLNEVLLEYWKNEARIWMKRCFDREFEWIALISKMSQRKDDSKDADWWKKGRDEN